MKAWLACIGVMAMLGSAATAAEECPATLDFYQRPLLGDKPAHLCEEFRGSVGAGR